MEQAASSQKRFPSAQLMLAVASLVLSVGLAYGTTRFAQGETQKSISTLEKQIEQTITREELKAHMDALHKIQEASAITTRDQLQDIKVNVIEIRKEIQQLR